MRATARPRSRKPWSHTHPETGPALHSGPAPLKSPLSSGPGCFLVGPDAGAVQKRHPELNPALLGEAPQALPHAQARPAEEGLSRPRPGPQLSRDGAPLGPVLMPPDDRRERAAQILWCGLARGPARLDQRLQVHPCSVRQHRSSSHWEEQNARHHNRFKREQALASKASLIDSWGGFPGGHRYDSRWRSPIWRSPWLLRSRSALTLMPPNSALWRSARGIPIRPGAFWLWRRSMMEPPAPRQRRLAV